MISEREIYEIQNVGHSTGEHLSGTEKGEMRG